MVTLNFYRCRFCWAGNKVLRWLSRHLISNYPELKCFDELFIRCPECGGTVKVIPKALAALAGQALACIEDPYMDSSSFASTLC